MLKTQFKMEMIVYTQDNRYSKKLVKRKREQDKPGSFGINDNGGTLKEMIKHLKSYYKVSVVYSTYCTSHYLIHHILYLPQKG